MDGILLLVKTMSSRYNIIYSVMESCFRENREGQGELILNLSLSICDEIWRTIGGKIALRQYIDFLSKHT